MVARPRLRRLAIAAVVLGGGLAGCEDRAARPDPAEIAASIPAEDLPPAGSEAAEAIGLAPPPERARR